MLIEFENVSTVHALRLIPIHAPGDIRMILFLDRIGGSAWGYYSLSVVRETPTAAGEASFANRAAALSRHVAGIASTPAPSSPVMASEGAPTASTASVPVPTR
jgi:hypothetical protein